MPGLSGGGYIWNIFGPGTDGAVALTSASSGTIGPLTSVANGVFYLTRDAYFTRLVLGADVAIMTNGFHVFVNDVCIIDAAAAITHNGESGQDASGATHGKGGANGTGNYGEVIVLGTTYGCPFSLFPSFFVNPGGNGGDGNASVGAGTAGSNAAATTNSQLAFGGLGGHGGSGVSHTYGNGGTKTQDGTTSAWQNGNSCYTPFILGSGFFMTGTAGSSIAVYGAGGGSGGGGGGSQDGATPYGGGGGGSSGGVCFVCARSIIVTGTGLNGKGHFQALGGNGGHAPAVGAGNGGGGAGGLVWLVYETASGTIQTGVNGGVSAGGSGTAGVDGAAGAAFIFQLP